MTIVDARAWKKCWQNKWFQWWKKPFSSSSSGDCAGHLLSRVQCGDETGVYILMCIYIYIMSAIVQMDVETYVIGLFSKRHQLKPVENTFLHLPPRSFHLTPYIFVPAKQILFEQCLIYRHVYKTKCVQIIQIQWYTFRSAFSSRPQLQLTSPRENPSMHVYIYATSYIHV